MLPIVWTLESDHDLQSFSSSTACSIVVSPSPIAASGPSRKCRSTDPFAKATASTDPLCGSALETLPAAGPDGTTILVACGSCGSTSRLESSGSTPTSVDELQLATHRDTTIMSANAVCKSAKTSSENASGVSQ